VAIPRYPGGTPRRGAFWTRLCVDHNRHRAVVGDLDHHASAEDASGDSDALRLERRAEALVERLRPLGPRGMREARAVPLRRIL
jgi:hypothetical protein